MKASFDSDEWYPVYTLREEPIRIEWRPDLTLELTEAELADFKKVFKEFYDWQKRLRNEDEEKTYQHGNGD